MSRPTFWCFKLEHVTKQNMLLFVTIRYKLELTWALATLEKNSDARHFSKWTRRWVSSFSWLHSQMMLGQQNFSFFFKDFPHYSSLLGTASSINFTNKIITGFNNWKYVHYQKYSQATLKTLRWFSHATSVRNTFCPYYSVFYTSLKKRASKHCIFMCGVNK